LSGAAIRNKAEARRSVLSAQAHKRTHNAQRAHPGDLAKTKKNAPLFLWTSRSISRGWRK
jgi:hypothetical protein